MSRAERRRQQKTAAKAAKRQGPGGARQALSQAMGHHAQGRLHEAEAIYRQILQADPKQPDALHLLGVVAHQAGHDESAVELIGRALAVNPRHADAHYNLGNALLRMGRAKDAADSFRKAVKIKSGFVEALCNLGVALKELGDLDEAAKSQRKAIALNPNYAEAHNNLGVALKEMGRPSEALDHFRKAAALNPGYAEALANLGNGLKDKGELENAVECYRKAVAIRPNYAEAHANLGVALGEMGRLKEAEECCRKAVAVNPDHPDAQNGLAQVLQSKKRYEDAIVCFDKAIAVAPDHPDAHGNKGNALLALGDAEAALACYDKSIAVFPDDPGRLYNRANALKALGRAEEAMAGYRATLDRAPEMAEARMSLAHAKSHAERDEEVRAMEDMYARSDITDEQRMYLAFGLGKSFEDLKRFDEAFEYFAAANAINRKGNLIAIEEAERRQEDFKELFTADFLSGGREAPQTEATPVFIIGMPRSGTTLVEQILASHPKVYGGGELETMGVVLSEAFDGDNHAAFIDRVRAADDEAFRAAGLRYVETIGARLRNEAFFTDKLPINFRFVGMIKMMLPHAKVVHCRRSPLDTCLSMFKNHLLGKSAYFANDLADLAKSYTLYLDLMDHWREALPGFIHDIGYESLVGDQEAQSKALLAFCGLEWDDACLDFHSSARTVTTASAMQVRQPIYNSSVQAWKRYERQLKPLIDILGAE